MRAKGKWTYESPTNPIVREAEAKQRQHQEQLAERRRPRLVHGGAKGSLHRFQIRTPATTPLGKDKSEQRAYFPRDLCLDRLGRFFSSGVSVSSTGREAQIFSLTSIIFPQSS